ncbi:MAG: hypothetical protein HQK87_03085 [Nitrospinae bacterium]|nr:hypothetical protein [Nitrospinota bacterium]
MNQIVRMCGALLCTVALVGAPQVARADDDDHDHGKPRLGQLFIQVFQKGDAATMKKLVDERPDDVPPEVMAMVQYAVNPDVPPQEQDGLFNVAGNMAKLYADKTKDERLLNAVRVNYQGVLDRRPSNDLPPAAVEKARKELTEMGGGAGKVSVFELESDGALTVEIMVRDDTAGGTLTPHIDMKTSERAKEVVTRNLPGVAAGTISWSSLGVGLKTVFIGEGKGR